MTDRPLTLVVIGGGAAGFFGAVTCALNYPQHRVLLLEKTRQVLTKVRMSGGGRCNVTHACFDPTLLVKNYPRGHKELRGPFTRFQPSDTIQWFESRGVKLKIEEDGRIFPRTDQSETIINCLIHEAQQTNVEVLLEHGVEKITREVPQGFILKIANGKTIACDRLLIASGSASRVYPLIVELGHTMLPLIPSLFTFNIPDSPFLDLSGVSIPLVLATLPQWKLEQTGPLLFTHWGLSGPVILKLSAWAARELSSSNYHTSLIINWLPHLSEKEIYQKLLELKHTNASKLVRTEFSFPLPKQLWKKLIDLSEISDDLRWSGMSHKQQQQLVQNIRATHLHIQGKTTYKQEFVTCGGIPLEEINFKTMESIYCPGLYFAGEILNIDGITGGFNFQNAWTTGWIAGKSIGNI